MTELSAAHIFPATWRSELKELAAREPLLVIAPVGSGAADLLQAVATPSLSLVWLTPTARVSQARLVASVISQLVRPGADDPESQVSPHRLVQRYGRDGAAALDIASGRPASDWTLARALGATRASAEKVTIAAVDAHRLPDATLWELRDLAGSGHVNLLASTHEEHRDELVGNKAAWFGSVAISVLAQLRPADWSRALPFAVHPSDLDWLLDRTRARAGTTLEVLGFRRDDDSLRSAWPRAVHARLTEAENVLNLTASLHGDAPRLLAALASGIAPYAAAGGVPSQRVARAMAKLVEMDLIERAAPRNWRIADPILGAALALRDRPALRAKLIEGA